MFKNIIKAYINRFSPHRYPLQMLFYLNNNCNLGCSFCEIGLRNTKLSSEPANTRTLTHEEIDKCIALCRQRKIKKIYITGGEPFLSKSLWYLLERSKENNLIVEDITTNGTTLKYLTESQIKLINDTTKDIIISIDSANPDEHDDNRGKEGTFKKIENLFNNNATRAAFSTNFSFNVVVHSNNIYKLKDIIDLGVKWSITHINFQPVSIGTIFPDMKGDVSKDSYIKDINREYERVINDLYHYSLKRNINTNLAVFRTWSPYYFRYVKSEKFFFNELPHKNTCSKVYNFIHINYNGDFLPCANLKPVANINDVDCFEKWAKSGERFKQLFKSNKYFPECKNCFCDFPANLRHSMLYYPVANCKLILRLAGYYLQRNKTRNGLSPIRAQFQHSQKN